MGKHSFNSKHPLISCFIMAVVMILACCLVLQRLMVITSYPVHETAQTLRTTKMTKTLFGAGSNNVPAQTAVSIERYYLVRWPHSRVIAKVKVNDKPLFVSSRDLTLVQSNRINALIANRGYPHRQVKPAIDRQFAKQSYHTFLHRPRGVIVHDTGTEHTTVASETNYMENNYANTGVFVHSFISAKQILNIANVHYMAQGAGPNANPYYVQFEMPHEYSKKGFALQLANAAYYTATILRANHLPVIKGSSNGSGTVWTHAMVSTYLGGTDHQDPNAYWQASASNLFATTYDVNDFVNLVQAYYNRL